MNSKISKQSISDLVLGKLSPEESLKLLKEIEQDPSISDELELNTELLTFARTHGKEIFGPEGDTLRKNVAERMSLAERLEEYLPSRRVIPWVTAVVAVCVLILGLVTVSTLTTDRYFPLARIDGVEFESRVRGPGQEDLSAAQRLYEQGQWEESLQVLERYIRAFPHSEMIDYVHYSAGAIYLLSSRRSFLSLFPSYDQRRVTRALDLLETSANISANQRLVEDSRWLRAKAFLMLGRPADAINELEKIKSLNGVKRDQAAKMVAEILRVQRKD